MAITRISITIPEELLDQLDRRAEELDRSRSWAVCEAVRRFVAGAAAPATRVPGVVGEPEAVPYAATPVDAAAEVAAARSYHLATDLRLTPAERLRRAEELARLGRRFRRKTQRRQIIGFDSYDDFYEWKKAQRAGA